MAPTKAEDFAKNNQPMREEETDLVGLDDAIWDEGKKSLNGWKLNEKYTGKMTVNPGTMGLQSKHRQSTQKVLCSFVPNQKVVTCNIFQQ
jgi:hypothetical protein